MRLAVLYDAHVHLPAFHALKAWRLAVMASSTSLFHHQISRRHWGGGGLCCATHLLCCLQQTCLEFRPNFLSSSSGFSFHSGHMCLEDFLKSATHLKISELPHFWSEFALDLGWHINQHVAHQELLLQSNLLSRNHLHIHNKFVQALSK